MPAFQHLKNPWMQFKNWREKRNLITEYKNLDEELRQLKKGINPKDSTEKQKQLKNALYGDKWKKWQKLRKLLKRQGINPDKFKH